MSNHDPLCPWHKGDWPDNRNQCLCPEFSAVRQDEAIKAADKYRDYLRAKVETLRETSVRSGSFASYDQGLRQAYADVLALLDDRE